MVEAGGSQGGGEKAAAGEPRRPLGAVVVALVVGLALVVAFAGRARVPMPTPADEPHASSLAIRKAEACLACHARGTVQDRPRGHTGRQDCWNCHPLASN